jgi:UDP-N-acetylglucosamine/UDP-N-acetylgalactosamine diphosphorylase
MYTRQATGAIPSTYFNTDEDIRQKLIKTGQKNVLHFFDSFDSIGRARLISQLKEYDLEEIKRLAEHYVLKKPEVKIPDTLEPVTVYPRIPSHGQHELYRQAERRGKELVKAGKVAAVLVAGGQGTRLGYEGPKGEFQVTPIKGKSLFQVFAEQLLAHSGSKKISWYIMTSDANDARTKEFFKENDYFGYNPKDIFFFKQGMMPAFGMDGQLLLSTRDSLALSPDGHGGTFRALEKSGALDDMHKRGIEHISYFQVDNPLVHTIDYTFIGLHDISDSEMSSKTVAKANALEKVGNFVKTDGTVQVIEYSDMPESLAKKTNTDGSLKFNAGSIAIHALRVSFIDRLISDPHTNLPWHRAEKKVPYIDEVGKQIKPETANAIKLEQFIFDAIPLARNALIYETDRNEEFGPVKNAEGADSPQTSRQLQINRAARWLEDAGIKVPMRNGIPEVVLEIDPLFAISSAELRRRYIPLHELQKGAVVYFGHDGIEGLNEERHDPTPGLLKKLTQTLRRVLGAQKPATA